MSSIVQIALDKSAQLNSKQDQTLLSRGFFTPIFDEKGKKTKPQKAQLPPATPLVAGGAGFQPAVPFPGASLLFSAGLTGVDRVGPPAPPHRALPSAPSRSRLLWNETAFFLQVVACKFSGRLLLNCVPIERNTITL